LVILKDLNFFAIPSSMSKCGQNYSWVITIWITSQIIILIVHNHIEEKKTYNSSNIEWHAPNSLKDSNVSPKLKTTEEQGVEAIPWLTAL
jgi:hypothetical protein